MRVWVFMIDSKDVRALVNIVIVADAKFDTSQTEAHHETMMVGNWPSR